MFAAACSSSVDLPMPGSPPIRTRDPGTTPPPRTRSNSPMPVESRSETTVSMSSYNRGPAVAASEYLDPAAAAAAPAPATAGVARSSTREFQAPQSAQRPSHFDDCAPHSWQQKLVIDLRLMTYGSWWLRVPWLKVWWLVALTPALKSRPTVQDCIRVQSSYRLDITTRTGWCRLPPRSRGRQSTRRPVSLRSPLHRPLTRRFP